MGREVSIVLSVSGVFGRKRVRRDSTIQKVVIVSSIGFDILIKDLQLRLDRLLSLRGLGLLNKECLVD